MKKSPQGWLKNLSPVCAALQIDQSRALTIMPADQITKANHSVHSPGISLLLYGLNTLEDCELAQKVLSRAYGLKTAVKWGKVTTTGEVIVLIKNLDDPLPETISESEIWLYVPAMPVEYSFQEFQEIIAHLRAPDGCPWDREQTHHSLRNNLMEETYEALEALDREDMPGIREELGDLLLQIVLHSQIAAEKGEFTMEDVIAGIYQKIIRRHPHVFSDTSVHGLDGVLKNWEKLKEKERSDKGTPEKGLLDGVPVILPSLTQAQELQNRAARVGFDWPSIEPVWEKVFEELEEVRQAKTPHEVEKELGDLLFAIVNLIRWYKVESESALRGTNQKFRRRFKHIEKSARKKGLDLQSMTLDEMDGFWNEAKNME